MMHKITLEKAMQYSAVLEWCANCYHQHVSKICKCCGCDKKIAVDIMNYNMYMLYEFKYKHKIAMRRIKLERILK